MGLGNWVLTAAPLREALDELPCVSALTLALCLRSLPTLA